MLNADSVTCRSEDSCFDILIMICWVVGWAYIILVEWWNVPNGIQKLRVDDDGYVSSSHVVALIESTEVCLPFFEQFPHINRGFVDMYKIRIQTLIFHISPVGKPVELKSKRTKNSRKNYYKIATVETLLKVAHVTGLSTKKSFE